MEDTIEVLKALRSCFPQLKLPIQSDKVQSFSLKLYAIYFIIQLFRLFVRCSKMNVYFLLILLSVTVDCL